MVSFLRDMSWFRRRQPTMVGLVACHSHVTYWYGISAEGILTVDIHFESCWTNPKDVTGAGTVLKSRAQAVFAKRRRPTADDAPWNSTIRTRQKNKIVRFRLIFSKAQVRKLRSSGLTSDDSALDSMSSPLESFLSILIQQKQQEHTDNSKVRRINAQPVMSIHVVCDNAQLCRRNRRPCGMIDMKEKNKCESHRHNRWEAGTPPHDNSYNSNALPGSRRTPEQEDTDNKTVAHARVEVTNDRLLSPTSLPLTSTSARRIRRRRSLSGSPPQIASRASHRRPL